MGLLASYKQIFYIQALLVERDTSVINMKHINKKLAAEVLGQHDAAGIIHTLLTKCPLKTTQENEDER